MQKSENDNMVKVTRHKTQASTTLNRRYVRRPTKGGDVVAIMKKRKIVVQSPSPSKVSAQQMKDQAIKKALAEATMKSSDQKMNKKSRSKKKSDNKLHFGFGRVMLALSCAAVAVFAIVYFVNLNMPDISLKVAAMQTGINASYPGYVPRDYNVSSITSENGKITIVFRNSAADSEFTVVEESSSWDSNALLKNYVKNEYGDNYTTVREQGLTIYVSGSNATWVNGGVLYKINAGNGVLTSKQIKSIAVSL